MQARPLVFFPYTNDAAVKSSSLDKEKVLSYFLYFSIQGGPSGPESRLIFFPSLTPLRAEGITISVILTPSPEEKKPSWVKV